MRLSHFAFYVSMFSLFLGLVLMLTKDIPRDGFAWGFVTFCLVFYLASAGFSTTKVN